jgi:hypothetical protein
LGKVVGMGMYRGNGVAWRRREAVGAMEFNGGETLWWETVAIKGSCSTPTMRGW